MPKNVFFYIFDNGRIWSENILFLLCFSYSGFVSISLRYSLAIFKYSSSLSYSVFISKCSQTIIPILGYLFSFLVGNFQTIGKKRCWCGSAKQEITIAFADWTEKKEYSIHLLFHYHLNSLGQRIRNQAGTILSGPN